ncbi:hypothetical protein RJ641_033993 [Dillenia turbinata]|uniref:Uncharacterized protein n=1 Tax=Dillenia turbinata TaxID=194707 RepID=A0AAN8ZK18_9MAGN
MQCHLRKPRQDNRISSFKMENWRLDGGSLFCGYLDNDLNCFRMNYPDHLLSAKSHESTLLYDSRFEKSRSFFSTGIPKNIAPLMKTNLKEATLSKPWP